MPWPSYLEGIDGYNSWAQAGAYGLTYLALGYLEPHKKMPRSFAGYMGQTRKKHRQMLTEHAQERSYGSEKYHVEHAKPYPYIIYRVLKDAPKLYSVTNGSFNVASTVGLQKVANINDWFTYPDLAGMMTNVTTQEPTYNAPTAINTADMFVEKCHGEFMITNSTTAVSARVFIAFVQPRRDLISTEDPSTAFDLGLQDASGSAGNSTVVGATPFSSERFVKNYKVLKVVDTILTAGATLIYKLDMKRCRKINNETLRAMNAGGIVYMKGWTTAAFMWFYGMPQEDAAATAPTFPVVKLLVTSQQQFNYQYVANNRSGAWFTNTIIANAAANAVDPMLGQSVAAGPV